MKKEYPKYIEISKTIISKIESGELSPGDKAPSENDLINTYKISNTTARKSLFEVELQGWVKRIKGKGTFVLNRSEDKSLTRILGSFSAMKESFNDNLIKEGFTPKNIMLEKTVLADGISARVNGKTYIIEGKILKIRRLRYADDFLLKDETRYISMQLCPRINMFDLKHSLIKAYENDYKLQLDNVERMLSSVIIHPEDENNYFDNNTAIPVFILDSAITCNEKKVVEIERSLYRGDKYKFSIQTIPSKTIDTFL
ncbi:MAG: GntR family transcriptional regulator [Tannerella sp.]|jgi:GntR family transcriptional regulator|nr:GntR family transcriptional regulator [Tannerella sp.]